MSNVVKSLADDRFGGYLILWGNQRTRDITGEYFTKATAELDNVITELGKLPVLYHHAADPNMKSTVIGVIDTMRKDDTGVWVEGQATKAEKYRKMVLPLVQQGLLAWSSGTFPKAKELKANGEITRWPIIEGSMTPTPAEYRMIVDHPIQVVKAAFDELEIPTALLDTYEARIALVKSVDLERERIAVLELEESVKASMLYSPKDHPRYPKGHPKGGQFMPKDNGDFHTELQSILSADSDFQSALQGAIQRTAKAHSQQTWNRAIESAIDTYSQSPGARALTDAGMAPARLRYELSDQFSAAMLQHSESELKRKGHPNAAWLP